MIGAIMRVNFGLGLQKDTHRNLYPVLKPVTVRKVPKRLCAVRSSASSTPLAARPSFSCAPTLFERVCSSLLFGLPICEGIYRLHLVIVSFFNKSVLDLVWAARVQHAAALAAGQSRQEAGLVQHYEKLSATACLLYARVQDMASELNSVVQPISLNAVVGWLQSQLHGLKDNFNREPLPSFLPFSAPLPPQSDPSTTATASTAAAASTASASSPWWVTRLGLGANGSGSINTTLCNSSSSSSSSGDAGSISEGASMVEEGGEGLQQVLQSVWAWVKDVVQGPPCLHSLATMAWLGVGIWAIVWSVGRCRQQQQQQQQQQRDQGMDDLPQGPNLLANAQNAVAGAFSFKRPELLLASALGAVLLRVAVAPLMPPCAGTGGTEQLVHDLYITSSTFLSMATTYVAAACVHRVLSGPLPPRPAGPALPSRPVSFAPEAAAAQQKPQQQQHQQRLQQQQPQHQQQVLSAYTQTQVTPSTPTAYDRPDGKSSSREQSTSSASAPQHPVFFSALGGPSQPQIASSLPKAVTKVFREGTLHEMLQAVQASAACGISCTTFYTIVALWVQGASAVAPLVSTTLAYIVYRGCVESLMLEVIGLTTDARS